MNNSGTWKLDDDRHAQQWVHGRVVLNSMRGMNVQHHSYSYVYIYLGTELSEIHGCELAW